MLKKIVNNKINVIVILLCVFVFALIRTHQLELFYDPFLLYFKYDYQNSRFPDFNNVKLATSLFLRFAANTIVSLIILYCFFKDIKLIKFASILFTFFFIGLILAFLFIVNSLDNSYNFILFYIRRFLIQPLLLLIFIPAFLFQKQQKL